MPALAKADVHPTGVPDLNSKPGAAYTVYLDFAGFNFTGTWGNGTKTPGAIPAYNSTGGDATVFTTTELSSIRNVWARVAEKYSAFSVNVTTVDPAVAAGKSDTDAARQAYYDSRSRLVHTVYGGTNAWNGGGGGVSYVNRAQYSYSTTANGGAGYGYHTNFLFSTQNPTSYGFIADGSAHEIGHNLGLSHQGDRFTSAGGTTYANEYSSNGGFTGNGTFAPVMGNSYSTQRGLWRYGNTSAATSFQNDLTILAANSGIAAFGNDGVGHSLATATAMPLIGTTVDYALAKGVIVPTTPSNPNPIGVDNYTKDYFRFNTPGGAVSLTLYDGSQLLTPGTADAGATLDGILNILDTAGNLIATGIDAANTLTTTYSGTLAAGSYVAQITSNGGYASTFDASAKYFSMGSYFLKGTGLTAVPEPAAMLVLPATLGLLARRRRQPRC